MPPSYEEIRQEFGFASLNSARKHLLQLHRNARPAPPSTERTSCTSGRPRSLEEPKARARDHRAGRRPAGGVNAAASRDGRRGRTRGKALGKSDEVPDSIDVPESLSTILKRGEHFALRVTTGDSMIDDGIYEKLCGESGGNDGRGDSGLDLEIEAGGAVHDECHQRCDLIDAWIPTVAWWVYPSCRK